MKTDVPSTAQMESSKGIFIKKKIRYPEQPLQMNASLLQFSSFLVTFVFLKKMLTLENMNKHKVKYKVLFIYPVDRDLF